MYQSDEEATAMADCFGIYPGLPLVVDLGTRSARALWPDFVEGGAVGARLRPLPQAETAGRAVAMPMWFHLSRPLVAALSNLPSSAKSGAMNALRRHDKAYLNWSDAMRRTKPVTKGVVRLTERDLKLFQKLNAAAWLSTNQIQRNFFSGKSANAVCKRLRKLSAGSFVAMSRLSSTEEAMYRLSSQGKLALVEHSTLQESEITIPTQLPRKIQHFI